MTSGDQGIEEFEGESRRLALMEQPQVSHDGKPWQHRPFRRVKEVVTEAVEKTAEQGEPSQERHADPREQDGGNPKHAPVKFIRGMRRSES